MAYDYSTNTFSLSKELERLKLEREAAVKLQERRHQDWNDTYELYRNKVRTNRLVQRQAVNIPLMKETVKTLLSKIDNPPEVEWKENTGDEYKELVFQEIWNKNMVDNKVELIDVLDKKNVLLYGFSAKKLNVGKEGIEISVLDVFDIVFDPLMNPWDTESARFILQKNIFKSVKEILADPKYMKSGKDDLKIWANSPQGLMQGEANRKQWEEKMERLKAMGVNSSDFNYFAGGDSLVNLTEHYTKVWNEKKKEFEKRVVVYAEDTIELYNETLMDCIGVDFWPFVIWSEDPETNDIYPDSVGDLVRQPNKVINIWYSQLVENRTLKNFQMHWYSPIEGYNPQTYTPGPGAMLPAPPSDDINKVLKPVEIGGLDDTLTAINFLTQVIERGSGATAIEKGQPEVGQQTLGEVQILVGKATERVVSMAKFYRMAWQELADKWCKMLEANAPKFLKLSKQASNGKLYWKRVFLKDWVSEKGYTPIVRSSSEQEVSDTKSIQKWLFVLSQFPNNSALRQIAQKRELQLLDLTPEELSLVEEEEKKAVSMPGMQSSVGQSQPMMQGMQGGQPQVQPQPQGQQNPMEGQLMQSIQQKLAQIGG